MKKVKLALARLSTMDKVAKARLIVTAMTGNANFPSPNPALSAVTTAADETETAFNNTQDGSNSAEVILQQKETILNNRLTQLASYVDNIAAGDETIINSAAMEATDQPGSAQTPGNVQNLKLTDVSISGSEKAIWKKEAAAKAYLVYLAVESPATTPPTSPTEPPPTPTTPGTRAETQPGAMPLPPTQLGTNGYYLYDVCTTSRLELTGLPVGKRIWVTVLAVGAGGKSGFSDPATIIVR